MLSVRVAGTAACSQSVVGRRRVTSAAVSRTRKAPAAPAETAGGADDSGNGGSVPAVTTKPSSKPGLGHSTSQDLLNELPLQLAKITASYEKSGGESLCRLNFADAAEQALNRQINIELSASYLYLSLYAYFSRTDVALPGMAAFFRASSDDERSHALQFVDYLTMRGGCVSLLPIMAPSLEFEGSDHAALEAFEMVLSLEKLVTLKLQDLAAAADATHDRQMGGFVDAMLEHQAVDIAKVGRMVTQLRRMGPHGGEALYLFDAALLKEVGAPAN